MNIKINYNEKTYNLDIWKHPEKDCYVFEYKKENEIPIEIIKDEIERAFDVKIIRYDEGGPKRYACDNYKDSNEYFYYFTCENND